MNNKQGGGVSLRRTTTNCLIMSTKSFNSNKIIPSSSSSISTTNSFSRSTSSSTLFSPHLQSPRQFSNHNHISNINNNKSLALIQTSNNPLSLSRVSKTRLTISAFLRSLIHVFSFHGPISSLVPTCRWLSIPSLSSSSHLPLGRKVTGTLFGHRKGHVTFAVQDGPRAEPALLIELAVSTSALVREMSSGLVRIALECAASPRGKHAPRMFHEPAWTMFCNGRKCGYATTRECTEFDCHVLSTVQTVSVGAGVIPLVENRDGSNSGSGELLYMRAKFERVVGSRDSEAFYMLNPDGNGGPELSIFFLRL